MTDSTNSSPMILTPESTGSDGVPAVSAAMKKARRQTAFYPNTNSSNKPQKPFSRSAAKRESVLALGSIEHLQHYFTKTGIAAKRNPLAIKGGLVPALGPLNHKTTNSIDATSPVSPDLLLPPTPLVRSNPPIAMPPHVRTYETDPETLLPGVVDDLTAVVRVWNISGSKPSDPSLLGASTAHNSFDVLGALKITTQAIRSIRNYLMSLPDESTGSIREQYRSKTLASLQRQNKPVPTDVSSQPDPLTLIRKSALELLTVLRVLEENSRLPLDDDAYDAQSDGGHSRGGSSSRVSSPQTNVEDLPSTSDEADSEGRIDPDTSVGYSIVHVEGRDEGILVWEDEDMGMVWDDDEPKEKKEAWDERLVLGGGWLYKQDVSIEHLGKERDAVSKYLDVVDEVLFEGSSSGAGNGEERGWEREKRRILQKGGGKAKSRRASSGENDTVGSRPLPMVPGADRRRSAVISMLGDIGFSEEPGSMGEIREDTEAEESLDEEELPEWAKRTAFPDDQFGRTHAILFTFLPSNLRPYLQPPTPETAFLQSLTSGQLLCMAYNACVRKSRKPWGYISKEGIHDIIALELRAEEDGGDKKEGGKGGWTFRRIDNLRLWIGALKLRYMLPIQTPLPPLPITQTASKSNANTPLTSPTSKRFPTSSSAEMPIMFDAKIVARRDEGWEEMLTGVLMKWVERVVEEKRTEGR